MNSMITFRMRVLLSVAGIGLVGVLWWAALAIGWIDSFFLPSPSAVARSFLTQCAKGDMHAAILVSLRRFGLALAVGSITGLAAGMLFGRCRWLYETFIFWIEFLRTLPVTALFPLFIALFKVGERPLFVACTLTAFLIMFVNTVEAAKNVPPELQRLSNLAMMSRVRKWLAVYLPSMLPQVSQGMRNAISVTFIVVIVSEIIMGVESGLGKAIQKPSLSFDLDESFAYVFATGFVGWLVNSAYLLLFDRLIHWRGK